jgi:dCTP deaminase
MILPQQQIKQLVKDGSIKFDPPLEDRQWGEASVDLRLGFSFGRLKRAEGMKFRLDGGLSTIAKSGLWENFTLKQRNEYGKSDTWTLGPNEFVLAMTHESVCISNHLIGMVQGRSTYARMGISIHQTAPWIQPGWEGKITLEIANLGPYEIEHTPLVDRLCQLTFFRLSEVLPKELAHGTRSSDKYQGQSIPLPTKED